VSEDVLQIFRDAGAILDGHFLLTSGRHSGTYLEKFQVLQYPQHTERLCRLIADHFRDSNVDLVAGPTTGGVILSYEVARQLGTSPAGGPAYRSGRPMRGIFAESDGDARRFQRGFRMTAGDRVRGLGGEPVGVGVLVDRSGGQTDFGLPFYACLELQIAAYDAPDCPLCRQGVPLTKT
jgi:orotate phosphoribosyltransferase